MGGTAFPSFSYAFQPIVDAQAGSVFAHEALIRGPQGESASSVLADVDSSLIHAFDRDARIAAIRLAHRLGLPGLLSLNFLPQALDAVPDAIDSMLTAAADIDLSPRNLILEVTEGEIIHDPRRLADQLNRYRAQGLRLAIDDFGAGYAGLNLLADFQPDVVKLDMALVRGIDTHGPRQAISRAVIQACDDLGIEVIAEGIETEQEYRWFRRIGVRLFQGYFFGRPTFEAVPPLKLPALAAT
ncbi:MAG: EAL domain-containing protein [Pseudomonadota bacterium]